eukprot:TRINITY_DN11309_c0_g4_i1.p1 TRINITY_DN11309_c0_g4~~TRINITY_DN11309_c0_g4_i1.p1  ORF type:complete len:1087 (+),score=457.69 TRINITY_DN11309_c0_g4_i1:46-3261(+)
MAHVVRQQQVQHGARQGRADQARESDDEDLEESEESDAYDRYEDRPGYQSEQDYRREQKRLQKESKLRRKEQKNKKLAEQREKVRGRMVPLKFAVDTLQRKFNSSLLMRDMVVYAPFLLLFMFFFYKGRDIEGSYWQSRNIADLLTGNEFANHPNFPGSSFGAGPYFFKTFFDPLLPGDFHDWLETVVVPLIFDPARPHVRGALNPRLTQSVPIGAMRVRNLKVKSDSCSVNTYFYSNNVTEVPRFCYSAWPVFWEDAVDKEPYGANGQRYEFRNDCGLDFFAGVTAEYKSYPCGGFITEVPFSWDYATAIDWAHNLRRGDFVNATSVRFLALEFFTYNIPLQSFSSHKFFWEITEGGAWVPQTQHRNFAIFSESAGLLIEFVFLLYVLYYCVRFALDWKEHKDADGKWSTFFFETGDGSGAESTYGAWNFLELVNLLCFLIVFGIRWIWWVESNAIGFKLPYDHQGYPDSLNTIMNLFQFQIYFNSVNTVISFLKILKYLRLNERLNILTRTLSSAQQDVMAVLVVFVLVLVSFAVSGNTLFGNGVHDFKNISISISTLMRVLLGDFDYLELWYENQLFAGLFFFGFVVLALFIIMNFIIGVVGTHFAAVQQDQARTDWADTIYSSWKRLERYLCWKSGCADAWKDFFAGLWQFTQRPAGLTILQYLRTYYAHQRDRMGAEKAKDIPIKFSYFLQLMPMAEFRAVREQNLQDNWEYIVDEWDKKNEDLAKKAREQRQKMQVEVISDTMRDMFQHQKKALQDEVRRSQLRGLTWEDDDFGIDFDFKNISISISTLMRVLLGDFDYLELWYENQLFAGLFFFGFVVLALFIIMNFIIGVVGTHFAAVQQDQARTDWADTIYSSWKRLERYLCWKSGCADAWKDFFAGLWQFTQRPAGLTILQYLRTYYAHQRDRMGAEKAKDIPIKFSYFLQLMPMAEFRAVREQNLQDNWEYIVDEWDKKNEDLAKKAREQRQKMQVEVISDTMRDMFQHQKKALQDEVRRSQLRGLTWEDDDFGIDFDFDARDREGVVNLREKVEEVEEVLESLAALGDDMHAKAGRLAALVRKERGLQE